MDAAVTSPEEGALIGAESLDGPGEGVTGEKGRLNGVEPRARGRPVAVGALKALGVPPETRDIELAGELSGALLGLLRQLVERENLSVSSARSHSSLLVRHCAVDFTIHLANTQFAAGAWEATNECRRRHAVVSCRDDASSLFAVFRDHRDATPFNLDKCITVPCF